MQQGTACHHGQLFATQHCFQPSHQPCGRRRVDLKMLCIGKERSQCWSVLVIANENDWTTQIRLLLFGSFRRNIRLDNLHQRLDGSFGIGSIDFIQDETIWLSCIVGIHLYGCRFHGTAHAVGENGCRPFVGPIDLQRTVPSMPRNNVRQGGFT